MRFYLTYIAFLAAILSASSANALESVVMQLRWHHQFQFAGYYAAKAKGFYQQAGFDVTIVAGSPERQPVTEVLAGRADFAQGNSDIIFSRLKGEDLVLLASIFQYSPSILLTLKDSGIQQPSDLIGKKVMLIPGNADADFFAMFKALDLDPADIQIMDSSYDVNDLLEGKVDAFNAYTSNEPYFLRAQNIAYRILHPRDYGVDFYSDMLFTSAKRIAKDPEGVARFKAASIRGWEYALENKTEIIELMQREYGVQKDLAHLQFEAEAIEKLVKSDLFEVGHIYPERIKRMAEVLIDQGAEANLERLNNFIFIEADRKKNNSAVAIVIVAIAFGAVFLSLVVMAFRMRSERKLRQSETLKLTALAETDELTGVSNRRAFSERLDLEWHQAEQGNNEFSLILLDLDHFKAVNDQFGHLVGDHVLRDIAHIVKETLREDDCLARYGGEEFIVLLPKTEKREAIILAERLRLAIKGKRVTENDIHISVTASLGVACSRDLQKEQVIEQADMALYEAKRAGRDQVISL